MGVRYVGSAGGHRLFRQTELTIFTAETQVGATGGSPYFLRVLSVRLSHVLRRIRVNHPNLAIRGENTSFALDALAVATFPASYSKEANAIRLQFNAEAGRIPR